MPDDREAATPESERLARRYFDLIGARDVEQILGSVADDVELTIRTRGGLVLRGRDELASFLDDVWEARSVYEPTAERVHAVGDERAIVEGRIRWMDDERVLRDDHIVWALEFHDGLLRRSVPARSVGEAQAILAAAPPRQPEPS